MHPICGTLQTGHLSAETASSPDRVFGTLSTDGVIPRMGFNTILPYAVYNPIALKHSRVNPHSYTPEYHSEATRNVINRFKISSLIYKQISRAL